MHAVPFLCLLVTCSALQAQPVRPDATRPTSVQDSTESRAEFDALPLRSVRELAALAPGVRRDLATGALTVRSRAGALRGALGREPVFMVDGVRQLDGPMLPFEAVERVRVLTEGVSARYGQAAGGLVLIETEAGAPSFGGRLEAFSSRVADAYDRDLGALSVRGPLGGFGGFTLSAELGRAGDAMPIGGPGSLVLTAESQAFLEASPQLVAVSENGETLFLPFPAGAARAAFDAGRTYTDGDLRTALGLSADAQVGGLLPTLGVADLDYERQSARDASLDDLRLAGTLDLVLQPQLDRRCCPTSLVVAHLRPPLMAATPRRPRHHEAQRRNSGPEHEPQQPTHLRDRQRDEIVALVGSPLFLAVVRATARNA